jgi:putative hydrolase of the HAD superfamily
VSLTYKAIFFDLDNTLYPYEPCHREGLSQVINFLQKEWNFSYEQATDLYEEARNWVHNQLEGTAASHHRLLYMSKLCEFTKKNPILYAKKLEELYWDGYFSQMALYDSVIPLLEELKNFSLQLGLITDLVADIQYKKILYLGLENFFDVVVTSEEAGREKPDPIIFQLGLQKLSLTSTQAFMVGDSYSKDIVGANSLGMRAFWLKGDPTKASEWIIPIQDLKEIKNFL